MYNKDYKKMIFTKIKDNCEKIMTKFHKSNNNYPCKSKNNQLNEIEDVKNSQSTNFLTFESEIGISKKKENIESDSSSSEEDDYEEFKKNKSANLLIEDNIGELLKKDFGYN